MNVDPTKFTEKDMFLIVFSQDLRSWFNFFTAKRTEGWGHVMIMHKPGRLASQGFMGFKDIPVQRYMKKGVILKFWSVQGLRKEDKERFDQFIKSEIERSWWNGNRYDWIGILGQLLPGKWSNRIQSPWANYCSEVVGKALRIVTKEAPLRASPEGLDHFLETFTGKGIFFKHRGYYFGE